MEDEDLKKAPLIGIVELFLKHAHRGNVIPFLQEVGDLLKHAEKHQEISLLEAVAQYTFETNKEDLLKEDILDTFKRHLSLSTQEHIMTVAQAFIKEGRKEGLSDQLKRLLERRFKGAVPPLYLHQIEEADSETLGLWTENLLDATKIEDVFLMSNAAH